LYDFYIVFYVCVSGISTANFVPNTKVCQIGRLLSVFGIFCHVSSADLFEIEAAADVPEEGVA